MIRLIILWYDDHESKVEKLKIIALKAYKNARKLKLREVNKNNG